MKISRNQQTEIRKHLLYGQTPSEVADTLGIGLANIYHHRKALVAAKLLEPLRKAAKKPNNKTHAGAVNYKFIMGEDFINDKKPSPEKSIKNVKTWKFVMTEYADGSVKLNRDNEGFDMFELLGLASHATQDICNELQLNLVEQK